MSQRHPGEVESIKKATLGDCIKRHVDAAKIKSVASRATRLGNDKTHYLRKWVDQDINDLKTLVKLTENRVHSHLLTERHEKDTQK